MQVFGGKLASRKGPLSSIRMSVCAVMLIHAMPACADEPDERETRVVRQLLTPMTSVINGKPFRDALQQIGNQSALNLCIDRRVDATSLVDVGQIGPTVFLALQMVADKRECEVVPVAGTVLIGRPTWIDQTISSLLLKSTSTGNASTYQWDDLTTPNEALRIVAGETASDFFLPHDLWPATNWTNMDQKTAMNLVLAQFDQRIGKAGQMESASTTGTFKRHYRSGTHVADIRKMLTSGLAKGTVRVSDGQLIVTTTARGHRLISNIVLTTLSKSAKPASASENLYSLNLEARAGDAFKQFAATVQAKCTITPAATNACQTIVKLTAKDKSIVELVQMVAQRAGVNAIWRDKELVIDLPVNN